jgi:putative glutamine amidotransferase
MAKRVGVTYGFDDKLRAYTEALRLAGLEPVPLLAPGPDSLDGLDGLLVSGGTDLDPRLYGQDPVPEAEAPDPPRDAMEARLLKEALDADLPVLAICRGMQIFNVVHGGTLEQHLPTVQRHVARGIFDAHAVDVAAGSRLADISGSAYYSVNSRHHQGVLRLGEGLIVTAHAPEDGVIEALERPDRRFAVAVQWHPEDRVAGSEEDRRLFEAFAQSL